MAVQEYLAQLIGKEDFIVPLNNFNRHEIMSRLDSGFDVGMVITGPKRYGKSTLGYWEGCMIDKRFNIPRNFVFKPYAKPIKERIWGLEEMSVVIIDEGIKALYRQNWYENVQKSLFEALNTTGIKRQVVIVCIPNFCDLRTSFTKTLVDYWIHLPQRGFGVIMGKSPIPFKVDPWNMKQNLKIFEEATKKLTVSELANDMGLQLNIYEKIPNYLGYVKFPMMPPEEERIYKEISDPAKKEMSFEEYYMEEKTTDREKKLRSWLTKALYALNHKVSPGWSQARISKEFGIDDGTISLWMKNYRAENEAERPKEVDADGNGISSQASPVCNG
ncbi:MAG: helix-turn-helix domain-containing protein [Candidatus Micrarchaeota archaeon]|nr:helix-turn-helix domain-containing protein [Candidatus Micrarchaeota archaeon]